jgi:hypothetical protein
MYIRTRSFLTAALLVASIVGAPNAVGGAKERLKVTQAEIVQLPKFCWREMGVPNLPATPEYRIQKCGAWANHYCEGLVQLLRAKLQIQQGKWSYLLGKAADHVEYTDKNTKQFPSCSIRNHIEETKVEILRLRSYGGTRSGRNKG